MISIRTRLFGALLGVLLPLVATSVAGAQAIVSSGQSFVDARLLPGAMEDGRRIAGLRLDVAKGWKTYWRNPGDAGVPPDFDWSASQNVRSVEVLWPRPEIFQSFGLRTIGYGGRVVLPLVVTPIDPARPITLALTADLGVCREICVLERFALEAVIPHGQSIGWRQIARARTRVPATNGAGGLVSATCRIGGTGEERTLAMTLSFDRAVEAPVVVIDGADRFWVSDVDSHQSAPASIEVSATLHMASPGAWVTRSDLRATVLAANLAADMHGCRAPAD